MIKSVTAERIVAKGAQWAGISEFYLTVWVPAASGPRNYGDSDPVTGEPIVIFEHPVTRKVNEADPAFPCACSDGHGGPSMFCRACESTGWVSVGEDDIAQRTK